MSKPFRLHLDENCDPRIARGLRSRGIDVTTTQEVGLRGVSDEEQLEYALASSRVIYTSDADFARLHASGAQHLGIIYNSRPRSIGEIIAGIVLICQVYDQDEMIGQFEYL